MAEVTVTVEQGKLQGKTGIDFFGKTYYSFRGIPFAKPPLGKLRFKDPQPAEPWEGTRDATKEGSACFQFDPLRHTFIGSEDCLYLNVYTPQIDRTKCNSLKPVMFWIHGGGFNCGSNSTEIYGPDFLIANDVVVVATNYRVGLLGFLQLDDPSLEVPGNAGLKDIVLALRWVKSNIRNFLGDPNNVTVFGESAGSAAVQYLLLSPLSEGLFHKAIMQSGSVFNPWARGHPNIELYAQVLGVQATNEREIIDALQEFSVEKLLQFQEQLNDDILDGSKRPFGPCPEKPSSNAFLSDEPRNIMLGGSYHKVPLLVGYCDAEGLLGYFLAAQKRRKAIHTDFENFVPYTFGLPRGSEKSKQIAQRIKKFYYKDKEPSTETAYSYVELETDYFFAHDIQKTIGNLSKKSQQPVFFYRFCFDGKLNFLKQLGHITLKGACHGDDVAYVFKPQIPMEPQPGSPEEVTMKRMTKFFTNFAKFGNPNSTGEDDLLNVEWKAVDGECMNYLNIDKELSSGVNPEAERMKFWDELFESYPSAKFW